MVKYCLNVDCRKPIWKKNSEYCSKKCETTHGINFRKKEWTSISIKSKTKDDLIEMQDILYDTVKQKISFDNMISTLIKIFIANKEKLVKRF